MSTPDEIRAIVYEVLADLVPTIAGATMAKTEREHTRMFTSPGTVVGTSDIVGGVLPYVAVLMDEDAISGGGAITIPSLAGGPMPTGTRVMVQFSPPHGAYVLSTISRVAVPFGSISNRCSGEEA